MLGTINTPAAQNAAEPAKPQKILVMKKNPRMAGSIPVWETAKSPAKQTALALENAQNTMQNSGANTALAYHQENTEGSPAQSEEFTFGDLFDMVNPMHHIPVVGHIYRELTGDEIKPIAQIIGGGVFGGPVGAASGLVNVIVEEETGDDVAGNALALLDKKESTPEASLASAQKTAQKKQHSDLPASLLAFAAPEKPTDITIEKIRMADGRTAGYQRTNGNFQKAINIKPDISALLLEMREPITRLNLNKPSNPKEEEI